jgi:TolB protein
MLPGETTALSESRHTTSRSAISNISESISIEIKRHKIGAAVSLLAVLLIVAAGSFGIYRWLHKEEPIAHFWDIKLSRLTNSGNAIDATISPDGKYIVYVLSDRSKQGLFIRQVSTANDKEILPPASVGFFGITFSPDGNDLYYVIKANLDAGTLYRVPVLGGVPVKIMERLDGPISFSPDGKQFVFIRGNYPNSGETALVIANSDSSGERDLVVKKSPERLTPIFFTGPSWSPDGKIIASSIATFGGRSKVVGFSVADGSERDLSTETWQFAGRVYWLPDMNGVLVVAGDSPIAAMLWVISYPDGKIRRITNDLNSYRSLALTDDGKKLVSVQSQGLVNLWVVPDGDATKAVRLPTGNVINFFTSTGSNVSLVPDGRIVYVSNEGGSAAIWITDQDGTNRKQLTANGAANVSPVVTADGRYVVFGLWQDGRRNLWRINLDGSNPLKLTSGSTDSFPTVSPDSRWVIYTTYEAPKPTLWKVSIDGGTPVRITDHVSAVASISPDGKFIAYSYPESADPFAPPNRITVIPFEGGPATHTFQINAGGTVATVIQWAPDSKSLLYSVNMSNVSNIWSQSLDGGPPKQVTDFKDLLITAFSWSRDGKQLVCTRGSLLRDAVLISDTK